MTIDIIKKEINQEECLDKTLYPNYNFNIEKIDYCCNKIKALFNKNVLTINFGEDEIYLRNKDEEGPAVCIRQSTIVDSGDYVYDGEDEFWQESYDHVDTFFAISKCPCCGEDIVINSKTEDVTKRVNEKLKMLPKNKKTKTDKEKRKEIYNEIFDILGKY